MEGLGLSQDGLGTGSILMNNSGLSNLSESKFHPSRVTVSKSCIFSSAVEEAMHRVGIANESDQVT